MRAASASIQAQGKPLSQGSYRHRSERPAFPRGNCSPRVSHSDEMRVLSPSNINRFHVNSHLNRMLTATHDDTAHGCYVGEVRAASPRERRHPANKCAKSWHTPRCRVHWLPFLEMTQGLHLLFE